MSRPLSESTATATGPLSIVHCAGFPLVSFESPDFADGVGWLRLNVRDGLRLCRIQHFSEVLEHHVRREVVALGVFCAQRGVGVGNTDDLDVAARWELG